MDFDTTENLYIEGDNLEVLKLLQETYLGKIKMIHIDPPYNTREMTLSMRMTLPRVQMSILPTAGSTMKMATAWRRTPRAMAAFIRIGLI